MNGIGGKKPFKKREKKTPRKRRAVKRAAVGGSSFGLHDLQRGEFGSDRAFCEDQ